MNLKTLLKTHTRQNEISVRARGSLVEVNIPKIHIGKPPDRTGTTLGEFSKASRLRLLKTSARIDWVKSPNPLFATLTYPDKRVPMDAKEMTLHRDMMARYMEEYLKVKLPIIWRAEWLPRLTGRWEGVVCPHLHMVIFTARRIPCELVNEWWKTSIKWDAYVRTEIERVKKGDQAGYYISKYVGKPADSSPSLVNAPYLSRGRHWGVKRKSHMAWGHEEVFNDLTPDELEIFLQAGASAMQNFQKWGVSSFSLFGKIALTAVKLLREKRLDKLGNAG